MSSHSSVCGAGALAGHELPQKAVSASRRHVMVFRDAVSCQIRSSASQRAWILAPTVRINSPNSVFAQANHFRVKRFASFRSNASWMNSVPAWGRLQNRQTHGNLLFVGANQGSTDDAQRPNRPKPGVRTAQTIGRRSKKNGLSSLSENGRVFSSRFASVIGRCPLLGLILRRRSPIHVCHPVCEDYIPDVSIDGNSINRAQQPEPTPGKSTVTRRKKSWPTAGESSHPATLRSGYRIWRRTRWQQL
jgi:hypothetical protein